MANTQATISISASSIVVPITDSLVIGSGAFIVPTTVALTGAAASVITGRGVAFLAGGSRISTAFTAAFVDRKFTVQALQRRIEVDVPYEDIQLL